MVRRSAPKAGCCRPTSWPRVAALDRDLGGSRRSDYHLAPNERLGEAIARSWARLTGAWDAFSTDRDGLPAGDHAGTAHPRALAAAAVRGARLRPARPAARRRDRRQDLPRLLRVQPLADPPRRRRRPARPSHPGVRGAADQSPHSLVQELLNRSDEHLWGIVTNGLSLRLLRDNVTLTRQAYVEFDLEAMFASEVYADFALLWLCAHQSRLEAETPGGVLARALDPGGAARRDPRARRTPRRRRAGDRGARPRLPRPPRQRRAARRAARRQPRRPDYYRQLLRSSTGCCSCSSPRTATHCCCPTTARRAVRRARALRSLLLDQRLRRLSVRRRGGRAHDLYEQVKLVSGWLHDGGQPALALPALGSFLWSPDTTAHLSDARLANEAPARGGPRARLRRGRPTAGRLPQPRRRGARLRLRVAARTAPRRSIARPPRFALTTAAGNERKTTGSYYTPTSLIASLLDSALDPVLDEAAQARRPRAGAPRPQGLRPGLRLRPLPHRRRPPHRQAPRRGPRAATPSQRPRRSDTRCATSCPLHLRRRRQPDGRRAVQGLPLDGGARARQAAVVPRPPHRVRQQPARRDTRAARRRASPTTPSSRCSATTRTSSRPGANTTPRNARARPRCASTAGDPTQDAASLADPRGTTARDCRRHARRRPRARSRVLADSLASDDTRATPPCRRRLGRRLHDAEEHRRGADHHRRRPASRRTGTRRPQLRGARCGDCRASTATGRSTGTSRSRRSSARGATEHGRARLGGRLRLRARQPAVGAREAPGEGVLRRHRARDRDSEEQGAHAIG